MKQLKLLFTLFAMLAGLSPAMAEELTVYDETTTNQYIPTYGYYADIQGQLSEFMIPATNLESINGATITELKFYANSASVNWGSASFKVYVKEVSDGALNSAFSTDADATTVYEGSLSIASSEMNITFATGYLYNGGNLLVGIYVSTKGTYNSASFYGKGGFDQVYSRYRSSASGNGNAQYFIPKTTLTYEPAADGPAFKVKGYQTGDSYSFGLVNPGATATLTLTNPGTESVTADITTTNGFAVNPTQVTIEAKGETTVTITAPDATAEGTVTFTPTAAGLDPVTINLSCTVKDPSKMFVDFADNALPEGWTTQGIGNYTTGSYASSYTWDFSKGYAWYKTSSSSAGYVDLYYHSLISPLVKFADGEKLIFKVKKEASYSSYLGYVRVDYTTNGTTWTAVENGTFADAALTTDWAEKEVTIPATAKQIRFVAVGIGLDDIYGGELSQAPVMKVTASDHNFGMIAEATSTTFTIANSGKSDLTGIEVMSSNDKFTVTDVPTTIAPGETATVTVTMAADEVGVGQEGTITISAPDQETVTFSVVGYVMDNTLFTETFDGNALPDGWTMESGSQYTSYVWTFDNGVADGNSSNARLITPALTVEEGEKMAIEVKRRNTWTCTLPVYVSKDGGEFTLHTTISNTDLTDDYKVFFIEGLEAGNYKVRFDGNGVLMNAVNGFHLNQNAPVFEMVTTGAAAFGKVTANAEKTYTVKNAGTGTLTVGIASDNEAFTVSPASLDIAAGETADFTITFNYVDGNFGAFNGNVTVTPTYNEALAYNIATSAKALDPNAWDEDFEDGEVPAGWEATNWTVAAFSYSTVNNTQVAKATANSGASVMVTPRLEAKAGDVLMWEALYDWQDEGIRVEYSDDDKATWNIVQIDGLTLGTGATGSLTNCYRPQDNGVTSRGSKFDMSFTAPADGFYYLRFTSSYNGNALDNFNGFKLALKDHDAIISDQNIRQTFTQYTTHQVSVTVKEMAGKEETLTARFFIGDQQYGEAVTETVAANGEQKFVIEVTLTDIVEGDAYITVTNDDINLESSKIAVTTKAAIVLDEEVAIENMPTGYQDKIVVKYAAKKGWNTICMPFALTADIMTALFGEGWKAYEFKANSNGALRFNQTTQFYGGFPYIVYCQNPPVIEEPGLILTYYNFRSVNYDKYGDVTFQGTYAPIAAPDMEGLYGIVPSTGRIQKGSATASLKGYRAYFEIPESVDPASLSFVFDDGTVITAIDDLRTTLFGNDGAIYDLQGRKVADEGQTVSLPKGIYIQNGKKVKK